MKASPSAYLYTAVAVGGPIRDSLNTDRMKSVSLTVPEIEVRTKEDKVMAI